MSRRLWPWRDAVKPQNAKHQDARRAARYVVLHHTGMGEAHFDLMIELVAGQRLATWRVGRWPPGKSDTFTPIGDHRREYLDYEGPVSGGRGEVRRVAAGELTVLQSTSDFIVVAINDLNELKLPRLR